MAREYLMREFANSDAVAKALAADVAERLIDAIAARARATLAVSGGTTPERFFDALSRRTLDWGKVIVTLVDERFVPPDHPRSNEKLVRERLLQNEARLARFVSLYGKGGNLGEAARQAEAGMALVGLPLDVVVLGMGTDGHTASFFADAAEYGRLIDPRERTTVLPVNSSSAGEARLTLSLAALCNARAIFLHIEGAKKRAVLEAAAADNLPIAKVLAAAETPVVTYWAP